MPLSNQHSCRILPPGAFTPGSFKTIEAGEGDNAIQIIIGRLKGETATTNQAIRYPKDTWSEAKAQTDCEEKEGSFEPALKEEILATITGEAKTLFVSILEAGEQSGLDTDAILMEAYAGLEKNGWRQRNGAWVKQYDTLETHIIAGVPIFAAGTHNGDEYTIEDLENMVTAFNELKGKVDPPLKVGHTTDDFNKALAEKLGLPHEVVSGEKGNGAIALGWIENLRRKGEILLADFTNVPTVLRDLIDSQSYRKVSAEIMWDIEIDGTEYSRVLSAVALLGAEIQAVPEAGLETAAVYTTIAGGNAKVIEFNKQMAGHDDDDDNPDDLKEALKAISTAVEGVIKNRSGARRIRAFWDEFKEKVTGMIEKSKAKKHTDEGNQVENQEEEDMKEIIELLGLDEKATREQMTEAIKALQAGANIAGIAKALELGDEATMDQVVTAIAGLKEKVEKNALPAEYSDLQTKVATLQAELKVEKTSRRRGELITLAANWRGVSGTPEEIAGKILEMEDKSPEAAEMLIGQFGEVSQKAIDANIFSAVGVPGATDEDKKHPFMVAVEARMKDKGESEAVAFSVCAKDKGLKKEYTDYRETTRVLVAANTATEG